MENKQVLLNWIKWIDNFVIEDIRKALESDMLEISLIILCLVGVESLSGYFSGTIADRNTFVAFIKRYFPPAYANYADKIYGSLRNGLLHDYVPKRNKDGKHVFVMCRSVDEPHLQPCVQGQEIPIWFNRETFARDFLAAWEQYKNDLEKDQYLAANLHARIKTRGYLIVDGLDEFVQQDYPPASQASPPQDYSHDESNKNVGYSGGTIEYRPGETNNME